MGRRRKIKKIQLKIKFVQNGLSRSLTDLGIKTLLMFGKSGKIQQSKNLSA
jgi:hypothetical protein